MATTDRPSGTHDRMTWDQICGNQDFRGRWIAVEDCAYDEQTGQATEGLVVDADDDLAELCSRMRDSEWKNCAIFFADANGSLAPAPN